MTRALREGDPSFSEKTTDRIDSCGAGGQPTGTEAMERSESLLVESLDMDRSNLLVAMGLEQRGRVGAIGLSRKTYRRVC